MDTELDGKVAQEVMGFTLISGRVWQNSGGEAVYVNGEPTEEERVYGWRHWNPSGNWAHFGLVLEKAIARKPYLSLCLEQGFDGKSYLGIFTTGSGYKQTTVEQWGDGSLEAACLAILGAWGNGR